MPEEAFEPVVPQPESEGVRLTVSKSSCSCADRGPVLRASSLSTNVLFRARELAALFSKTPDLASTNALERAFALDWLDRFDEAWAVLGAAAAREDAPSELLLLYANYLVYGRPGVPDLLDPDRPGFYRPGRRAEAEAALRRVVARADAPGASLLDGLCAARAALLSDAAGDLAGALARLDRIDEACKDDGRRRWCRERVFALSLRSRIREGGGDPGTVPLEPADPGRGQTHYIPGPGGPGDHAYNWDEPFPVARSRYALAETREKLRRWRGADGMAAAGLALLGETPHRWPFASPLRPDPAWAEWWLRRAAIRGNAEARARLRRLAPSPGSPAGDGGAETASTIPFADWTPEERAARLSWPPPDAQPTLLALVADDGTALFAGPIGDPAEAPSPELFAAEARFAPGAAARTPLASVRTLVVARGVGTIPDYAFAGLPELRCVVLPESVRTVAGRAFADCPALESAVFLSREQTTISLDAFDGAAPSFALFHPAYSVLEPRPIALWSFSDDHPEAAPTFFLRGLGLSDGESPGAVWSRVGDRARYTGLRVEGGRAFVVAADGTEKTLRRYDTGEDAK